MPKPRSRAAKKVISPGASETKAAKTEPLFIEPMAPKSVADLPEGKEWSYEVKFDGFRTIAIKFGDSVRLFSRNNRSLAQRFPGIVAAVRKLGVHTAVIDGEIVALDTSGRPSFSALTRTGSRAIHLYAFDLLQLEAEDLKDLPLDERRKLLQSLLKGTEIKYSESLDGTAAVISENVRKFGLEGIVAKRRDSTYRAGERGNGWVKKRLSNSQEFVVGGYTPGTRNFDALLLGYYEGSRLVFAGKVRAGLTPLIRVQLWRLLEPLRQDACPFADVPTGSSNGLGRGSGPSDLRWLEPKTVVEAEFVEWTSGGRLRLPVFKQVREEKTPKEVSREE